MAHPMISRIAGPIALGTGALLLVQQLVMASFLDRTAIETTMANPLYLASAVTYFVTFVGLLLTLVTAYSWEADEAGVFGVIGFLTALIGTAFLGGDLWFEGFAVPWLGDVAPASLHLAGGTLMLGAFVSYCLFAGGWLLFGLASFRARVFPRLISIAIAVGGVIGFYAAMPPFAIPLALAIGTLGIWMIRTSAVRHPSAALAAA